MVGCCICGWRTPRELIRDERCLECSEFRRRSGCDREPPTTPGQLHRGETWPSVSDPVVRAFIAEANRRR